MGGLKAAATAVLIYAAATAADYAPLVRPAHAKPAPVQGPEGDLEKKMKALAREGYKLYEDAEKDKPKNFDQRIEKIQKYVSALEKYREAEDIIPDKDDYAKRRRIILGKINTRASALIFGDQIKSAEQLAQLYQIVKPYAGAAILARIQQSPHYTPALDQPQPGAQDPQPVPQPAPQNPQPQPAPGQPGPKGPQVPTKQDPQPQPQDPKPQDPQPQPGQEPQDLDERMRFFAQKARDKLAAMKAVAANPDSREDELEQLELHTHAYEFFGQAEDTKDGDQFLMVLANHFKQIGEKGHALLQAVQSQDEFDRAYGLCERFLTAEQRKDIAQSTYFTKKQPEQPDVQPDTPDKPDKKERSPWRAYLEARIGQEHSSKERTGRLAIDSDWFSLRAIAEKDRWTVTDGSKFKENIGSLKIGMDVFDLARIGLAYEQSARTGKQPEQISIDNSGGIITTVTTRTQDELIQEYFALDLDIKAFDRGLLRGIFFSHNDTLNVDTDGLIDVQNGANSYQQPLNVNVEQKIKRMGGQLWAGMRLRDDLEAALFGDYEREKQDAADRTIQTLRIGLHTKYSTDNLIMGFDALAKILEDKGIDNDVVNSFEGKAYIAGQLADTLAMGFDGGWIQDQPLGNISMVLGKGKNHARLLMDEIGIRSRNQFRLDRESGPHMRLFDLDLSNYNLWTALDDGEHAKLLLTGGAWRQEVNKEDIVGYSGSAALILPTEFGSFTPYGKFTMLDGDLNSLEAGLTFLPYYKEGKDGKPEPGSWRLGGFYFRKKQSQFDDDLEGVGIRLEKQF